jgi:diguanylate cyclase (GGDEF)-like protein/PAS domain S-box-containing protein
VDEPEVSAADPAANESEERYRRLVDLSPDSVFVIQDGYHVFANVTGLALLGAEKIEDLQRRPANEFMHPAHRDKAAKRMSEIREGRDLEYLDEQILTLQGEVRDIEAAGREIMYQGRPAVLVVIRDVGVRKAAELAQQRAERRFQAAFVHAPIGMAILDLDGLVTEANPALSAMLGYDAEELAGRSLLAIFDQYEWANYDAAFHRLVMGDTEVEQMELQCLRAGGEPFRGSLALSAGPEESGHDRTFVVHLQDVTLARTAEAKLAHQAMHDPLTDLPNRLLFMDRLEQAVRRAARHPRAVSVLFIDLDGFKGINDTFGHAGGDVLLLEVARRLPLVLRPSDTVARLGGDEFAVLIEDAAGEREAVAISERLSSELAQPIEIEGKAVVVTASIGAAVSHSPSDAEAILHDADAAMYSAKQQGKARCVVFDVSMRPHGDT